ncbi:arginine decarboxylase SpeA [Gottschalkia purinilytica]|uniref:Arginine decarboxylase SpeA n=1 Tax=Gottschalkia purinilytica TaxID=1503 RepID=A0A0L0WEE4_GOTPU|nr:aminotransferase class I/II-fold pyridoxal phosphate-dependent enzyme [Gottschalkia purinilytica]KNF09795.1 arginine decarboxylase SpeA [Gottschalkia purinilytica]
MMLNQNKTPLFDALKEYHARNVTPFDVPGHKHGKGLQEFKEFLGPKVLEVDVNSMKPLDNLNNPKSVIKNAQELAADAYSADHAFFLVNGTTSAVQAMIMAVCKPGDKIILPRNAHKSVVNGIILSGAEPVYIQPEINETLGMAMGISCESVEKAIIRHPDAKAILIINPTYYGVVSDVKNIVKIAHKNKIAVLVDEAHGAHFNFHQELPQDGIALGADMCAVSSHKTGGALTQSSLLLLNEGLINPNSVRTAIELTQTTSASYLLMSSLDVSRKVLAVKGKELLDKALKLSRYARKEINKIIGYYAFSKELIGEKGVFDFDETKLGINVSDLGLTGFEVYDMLRDEYNIQVEMGDIYNILAIISIGDDEDSINKLIYALRDVSDRFRGSKIVYDKTQILENPEVVISPRNAFYSEKKVISLEEAEGEISGEFIMAYPPGIPIVAPGERITKKMIEYVEILKRQKTLLQGTEDSEINYIKVISI